MNNLRTNAVLSLWVHPGFVVSEMTARNAFSMPFLVKTDKAARIIRLGLKRDKARIAFPWPMFAMAWLMGALPPSWTDRLFRNLPKKV